MSVQSNSPSKRRLPWVVKKIGGHYRHNVCGSEVTATAVADGILVCCEQNIELLCPGTRMDFLLLTYCVTLRTSSTYV
ncbi:MAG: hypothetical protein FJ005_03820 [Chloroflexi bacterium]|nr:hypothetical protein [Chloroflexota bacterium]